MKITEFDRCPKCGQSVLRDKPDGNKVCCNPHCRHEWTPNKRKN